VKHEQKLKYIQYGALGWSALYMLFGIFWVLGAPGFPLGIASDPHAEISFFSHATTNIGAPVVAVVGMLGSAAAVAMIRAKTLPKVLHYVLIIFVGVLIATLILLVPDYRALVAVGYAPIFLLGLPFGWPDAHFLDVVPWPVINQMLCIAGGVIWALSLSLYLRRQRNACLHCGRTDKKVSAWFSPAAAKKWGTLAVAIAFIIPAFYALTRWAWAIGIPLGIPEDFLREGQANGMWMAAAALATLAFGGAVLTLGLVQRWGEVFPGWVVFLRGKRVPMALAIIPATFVSILVTSAGIMFIRLAVDGSFPFMNGGWGTFLPEMFWPLWGISLGLATLAYYYRRRGTCAYCGRRG
jgi:hypothetical protein